MRLIVSLSLVLFVSFSVAAPEIAEARPRATAKTRKIRKLLKLTGAAQLGRQIMVQMIARFRATFPKVPQKYWKTLLRKANIKALMNDIVAVYDRHLQMRDVDGLIAFYSSPLGKRFVALQPTLLKESMALGRRWGQKLTREVVKELKKRKYIK